MKEIDFGLLSRGPHANLIHEMAKRCWADERIQAIWVGGSLAAGHGDAYSDVDFRIAVEPGTVAAWSDPDWEKYLPLPPVGGTFMQFGKQALLHHLVLTDGTIVDFYVQDTERQNFEPQLVILACRNAAFGAKLEQFARPAATLIKEIDGAELQRFFVDYWITTHKELKGLARKYDLSPFVGLYWERLALLRAWYIEATGKDISGRATLHMLGALHKGLEGQITQRQRDIVGLPSRTAAETAVAVEAIRAEMAQIGHRLSTQYGFVYPHELETIVQQRWAEYKAAFI